MRPLISLAFVVVVSASALLALPHFPTATFTTTPAAAALSRTPQARPLEPPRPMPAVHGSMAPAAPAAAATAAAPAAQQRRSARPPHAFTFTRGIYSSGGGGGRRGWGNRAWATDYPKADQQFLTVLDRLTILDASDSENAVTLDDPELRRFPFVYALEVGRINLSPAEVRGLRDYLLAGGFLFIDDFWGDDEWWYFENQIRQVLPEYPIVDLPITHGIYRSFYEIREILMVPSVGNARDGRHSECGPCQVQARGIFDERGRLLVFINWNTDIGDAWEWAEQPDYPLYLSTYAFQVGANAILYAMSH